MSTVIIYQFEVYRIDSHEDMKSRRWGTREAIRLPNSGPPLVGLFYV